MDKQPGGTRILLKVVLVTVFDFLEAAHKGG